MGHFTYIKYTMNYLNRITLRTFSTKSVPVHLYSDVQRWMHGQVSYPTSTDEYEHMKPYLLQTRAQSIPKHTWSGIMGEAIVESILEHRGIEYTRQPYVITPTGNIRRLDFETPTCLIEVKSQRYTTNSSMYERLAHVLFQMDSIASNKIKVLVLVASHEHTFRTRVLDECPSLVQAMQRLGVFVIGASTLEQDLTWLDGLDDTWRLHTRKRMCTLLTPSITQPV